MFWELPCKPVAAGQGTRHSTVAALCGLLVQACCSLFVGVFCSADLVLYFRPTLVLPMVLG
jgi:hypothetical protein